MPMYPAASTAEVQTNLKPYKTQSLSSLSSPLSSMPASNDAEVSYEKPIKEVRLQGPFAFQ